MINFNDPENVANRQINIDDVSAVISLLLIEVYHDLAPPQQFEDKLTRLASQLMEHADGIKVENRSALLRCVAAYLMSTEPGVNVDD